MIFHYTEDVQQLVQEQNWQAAVSQLKTAWETNKRDLDAALCYGCMLWFVLMADMGGHLFPGANHQSLIQAYTKDLRKLSSYSLSQFKDDPTFLAIWGWMISLMPYYFFPCGTDDEYKEAEQRGLQMLRNAYSAEPQNIFIKALYYATTDQEEAYRAARSQMGKVWENYLADDEFVGTYFLSITADLW